MIEYAHGRQRLSQAQEDYLKALYQLSEPDRKVGTAELAQRLGISPASVSEMVSRLSGRGLIQHDRFQGQSLTAEGRRIALELVRHHRLVEMFLVKVLGYSWDEVHEEAERLEHVISERLEERIFELLGRPDFDPHGDAIPSRDGSIRVASRLSLVDCREGSRLLVGRVSDADPAKLRALQRLGLVPGAGLLLLAASEYEGPISVELERERLQ